MDWYHIAQKDWEIYRDHSRIAQYVAHGKLTPEQFKEITGEEYEA